MSRIFRGVLISECERISLMAGGVAEWPQWTYHVVICDDLLAELSNDIYSMPAKTTVYSLCKTVSASISTTFPVHTSGRVLTKAAACSQSECQALKMILVIMIHHRFEYDQHIPKHRRSDSRLRPTGDLLSFEPLISTPQPQLVRRRI